LKSPRYNKVIGLSLGEQSLLAAEVALGEKPAVKRAAEFAYPEGVTLDNAAALGKALGEFLRANGFAARHAAVGIPVRWLAVKAKDVPPADAATLAEILRLQTEGEFSAELKELVYDYTGASPSVMLIATQKKYVDAAAALCEAAGLTAVAVTPSAVALGSATSRTTSADAMVLAVSAAGAEFTAQNGTSPVAVKPLRSASTGEVRRAVSAVSSHASPRELVLWDGLGVDARALGSGLGIPLQAAELGALGVEAASLNGTGSKFAPAVAVALEVMGDRTLAIDFLHSRLAPPKQPLVPRWAVYATVLVVLLIGGLVWAYTDLQHQQVQLNADSAKLLKMKDPIASADAFVSKVNFARAWHSDDVRYLACLRDLTQAVPGDDDQTYATNLLIREQTQTLKGGKVVQTGLLTGTLAGKTSEEGQQRVQKILDRLYQNPNFVEVKPGGSQNVGRGREVSFQISFTYRPGKG
jgi:hypothetical protein